MNQRPFEIKATHLARKAAIYVRQSTDAQVMHHRGSTEYQLGQRRHAIAWGWQEDQIEVIDEDLGRTGSTTAHRTGYQRLLREIEANQVGAVFVSDESRLGREPIALFEFVNKCLAAKLLLVVDGRIADLTDSGAFFQARLTAILNEFDNRKRREHLRRGIEARVAAGKAVSRPPIGYVRGADGSWEARSRSPGPDGHH